MEGLDDSSREGMVTHAWLREKGAFEHWDAIFLKKLVKELEKIELECREDIINESKNSPEAKNLDFLPTGIFNLTFEGFKRGIKGYKIGEKELRELYKSILLRTFEKAREQEGPIYYSEIVEMLGSDYLQFLFKGGKGMQDRATTLYAEFLSLVDEKPEKNPADEAWRQRCIGFVYFYMKDYSPAIKAFQASFVISEMLLEKGKKTRREHRMAFKDFMLDIASVYKFMKQHREERGARGELLKQFEELSHAKPRVRFARRIYFELGKKFFEQEKYYAALAMFRDGLSLAIVSSQNGVDKKNSQISMKKFREKILETLDLILEQEQDEGERDRYLRLKREILEFGGEEE